ncbi:MAG: hypothetical protein HZA08_06585 [Nitrospirae bacterium]|nr:hypothetical protein [Nitrospirota bacterium]
MSLTYDLIAIITITMGGLMTLKMNIRPVRLIVCFIIILILNYAPPYCFASNYSFNTIDYPGAVWSSAHGVNNAGQIVGRYWGNGDHGFIATPTETITQVPEPLTFLLLFCGITEIIILNKVFLYHNKEYNKINL